jgi:hypothetical protein
MPDYIARTQDIEKLRDIAYRLTDDVSLLINALISKDARTVADAVRNWPGDSDQLKLYLSTLTRTQLVAVALGDRRYDTRFTIGTVVIDRTLGGFWKIVGSVRPDGSVRVVNPAGDQQRSASVSSLRVAPAKGDRVRVSLDGGPETGIVAAVNHAEGTLKLDMSGYGEVVVSTDSLAF